MRPAVVQKKTTKGGKKSSVKFVIDCQQPVEVGCVLWCGSYRAVWRGVVYTEEAMMSLLDIDAIMLTI